MQLGENPKNVNNCGSLGVETLLNTKFLKKDTLIRDLKINFNKKNLILTFHPETFESKKTNIKFAKIIIEALRLMKDINFFITSSNIDRYGEEINKIFYNASKKYGNFYFFESLGREKYFSLLKYSDGVIGNSSSGIIEVPSLKKGTINLGIRQKSKVRINLL